MLKKLTKRSVQILVFHLVPDGFVSLPQGEKITMNILHSASFILGSVLPFSNETFTGDSLLICAIGLTKICVPLHKVVLYSYLIQGGVQLGVRPALPVEGISVILGNNLAREWVWSDVSSPLIVSSNPVSTGDKMRVCRVYLMFLQHVWLLAMVRFTNSHRHNS